jgi:hypothetical protein
LLLAERVARTLPPKEPFRHAIKLKNLDFYLSN